MFRSRQTTLIVLATFLLLASLVVFLQVRKNHREIHIQTDSSSLKFEIAGASYNINKELTISPKPGYYNYRASATVDGKRIVLVDKVNLVSNKEDELVFNLSIYNKDAITKAVCSSYVAQDCPVRPDMLNVVFLENYKWAVADVSVPGAEKTKAVLRMDNGSWKLMDGPGTDIEASGYYPESVVKAVENE